MFEKRYVIFLLIISALVQLPAQNDMPQGKQGKIPVQGRVIDKETASPLEFATVAIYSAIDSSLADGAMTNDQGIFLLKTTPGEFFMKVDFISYRPESISVSIGTKAIELGDISMGPQAAEIGEIEIREERSQVQLTLDKKVFQVGKDLANTGGNASDILDNVPSVTVDVEGQVSLRGSNNVRILIDGKPSGLVGVGDTNGLRQLPANMIDKVEVITNPSSKFEAEGAAGIINIVLKKDKRKGLNGSFDVSVGYPELASAGVNLNYRKNKFNFFTNLGLQYQVRPGGGEYVFQFFENDSTYYYDEVRKHERGGLSHNIRFGADYSITPKDVLTASLLYKASDEDNASDIEYFDFTPNTRAALEAYSLRTDREFEDESNLEYNLAYKKTFNTRKHSLTMDWRFKESTETEGSDLVETFFDGNYQPLMQAPLLQQSGNTEGEKSWVGTLDYVRPLQEKAKLETGLRVSFREVTNDYQVEQQVDGLWQDLSDFTNNFLYDEDILAAYIQYGQELDLFSYQMGLRVEHTSLATSFINDLESNSQEYTNLFPSAALSYKFTEKDALQVSYSQRIRRPSFRQLNPFFTFSDSRNFFSGNPNLQPEYTDSYEIGWIRYATIGTINAAVYYRNTDGLVQRIRTTDAVGFSTTRPENMALENAVGLELNLSLNPVPSWKLDANTNFFYAHMEGEVEGVLRENETTALTARLSSRHTLAKTVDLQLQLNYRGPRSTVQGDFKGITVLNLGANKEIFKEKATITFSVKDVFNSRRRAWELLEDDFYSEGFFQWRARTMTLSINYRLNQKKQQRRGRPGAGGSNEF